MIYNRHFCTQRVNIRITWANIYGDFEVAKLIKRMLSIRYQFVEQNLQLAPVKIIKRWKARNRQKMICLSITLILTLTLSNADADENKPSEPVFDSDLITKTIELKAQKLGDSLKSNATRLTNSLMGTEPTKYPFQARSYEENQTFDFQHDVRPIFDKKCVACHSCYEAPCQLNFEHPQGFERGASKIPVYDGLRLQDIPPTRLHTDAQTVRDWRQKGFWSVLDATEGQEGAPKTSLLQRFLDLGRTNPIPEDKPVRNEIKLGLQRVNSCPAPSEFSEYASVNVHGGMPLAVAGLNKDEFGVVSTWLKEGAKINARVAELTKKEKAFVVKAETWLNRQGKRQKLVARYIYEHLFLAHLYLEAPTSDKPPQFFKIIRSVTPPGQLAIPLGTVRPNDPPESAFYYRMVLFSDRIVHKTHITYRFDENRLAFFEDLFLKSKWAITQLPDYSEANRANPFLTFQAIPAKSRYQFLLNDAAFFVRNFIRGPVCNGQVATSVIRDNFWVMFEDPAIERYVNDRSYQNQVNAFLGVPGQKTSLVTLGSEWVSYQNRRNEYLNTRQAYYKQHLSKGPTPALIWNGNGSNDNAFLTVFRHHTNASVTKGWRGAIPQTAWLMDYPLLERTFYELVVGFDVFAGVSHQVQTRLYFDLIRNEGETNFLSLLPADARRSIYDNWYQADAKIKSVIVYHHLDETTPSANSFKTDEPKEELLNIVMGRLPDITKSKDRLNRCKENCESPVADRVVAQINRILQSLTQENAQVIKGIGWLPEVSFLRIELPTGDKKFYSLLRNRQHSNVAFIFGESLRRQDHLDSLTILPELIGSYPNMIFRVKLRELENFRDALTTANSNNAYERIVLKWGVLRMSKDFWDIFHSFTNHMKKYRPLEAGIYDLNRYSEW